MENQHNCLKIEVRPTDYVKGDGKIPFKAVNQSGVWASRLEFFENQSYAFETDGCLLFTAQESFDAQMDNLIAQNLVPQNLLDQFNAMGYMDLGKDNLPHFHSSPRFLQMLTGNGMNGNRLNDAWDVMRKYGVLPWKDLPFDPQVTLQSYLDMTAITPAMYEKAAQFLSLIGGANSIQYHWVIKNVSKTLAIMQEALQQAPLCLGVAVAADWNQFAPSPDPAQNTPPAHSVMNYQIVTPSDYILDHYVPFEKVLDAGYPINYALQGVITLPAQAERQVIDTAKQAVDDIAKDTTTPPSVKESLLQEIAAILETYL